MTAWEQLHAQCHEPLLTSIRLMLRPARRDPAMADEIAAQVWYALVANDGELLERYDPAKGGRIGTFLRTVAKDIASRHYRAEHRRTQRELVALRARGNHQGAEPAHPMGLLAEFLSILTPHERKFAGTERLLSPPPAPNEDDGESFSRANFWQLSRRIHRKLHQFLGQDD